MRKTEVRKSKSGDGLWVVDIKGISYFDRRYVQPDGSAGDYCKYPCREHAEAAKNLYLAKGKKPSTEEESNPADALRKFGHPAFYELLDDMAELHSRKNHDYAGTSDPLKNLRACVRLDLEPFMGVMVRLQDKWSRLEEFVKSNELMVKNESVVDTLMDNAVYSLLAIILYQEQLAGKKD